MVEYDPKLIYEFADRLYKKAKYIIATYVIVGFLSGLLIGGVIGYSVIKALEFGIIFGPILGVAIGYEMGAEKVFELKLKAQTALCQLKIEENIRKL